MCSFVNEDEIIRLDYLELFEDQEVANNIISLVRYLL